MEKHLSRRQVTQLLLFGTAATCLTTAHRAHAADSPAVVEWFDLVPRDSPTSVNHAYDGRIIRIAGYIVPIEYDSTGATEFLLVPYVGACIHVPPPPPNQIIYVKSGTPYEVKGLFEPAYVTGELRTEATSAEIPAAELVLDGPQTVGFDVAYTLSAEKVEPYVF